MTLLLYLRTGDQIAVNPYDIMTVREVRVSPTTEHHAYFATGVVLTGGLEYTVRESFGHVREEWHKAMQI